MSGGQQIYRRVREKRVYKDGTTTWDAKTTFSRPDSLDTTNPNTNEFLTEGFVEVKQYAYPGTLLAKSKHFYHGNATDSLFWQGEGEVRYSRWREGREWKSEVYDKDSTTLLEVAQHTWKQPTLGNTWPVSGAGETSETARPNDAQISDTTTTLKAVAGGGSDQASIQTFAYDKYTNRTEVKEYGFGQGTSGIPVRRTTTSYVTAYVATGTSYNYDTVNPNTTSPSASSTYHLRGLPLSQSLYDQGGAEIARTSFEYDLYTSVANHAPLTARSNITRHDATYSTSFHPRGNLTATTSHLLVNGTGTISAYRQYDVAGNLVKSIDGRGYATTFDYSDRFGSPDSEARSNTAPSLLGVQSSFAFATVVTNALGQSSYTQYDYHLGRAINGEDPDGIITKGDFRPDDTSASDALDRPRRIVRAVGTTLESRMLISYDDANLIVTTQSDLNDNLDGLLHSEVLYDRLGRTIETRQYEPGGGYIATKQAYDALGRVIQTSNPYRPASETLVWTTTEYDGLGRVIKVITPDGAMVTTEYADNRVLVTDQAGKMRLSKTDALGRLTDVWEITSADTATEQVTFPNHAEVVAGYRTRYTYDALDDLTSVTQQAGTTGITQTRTFAYDSLKRLKSATNPESGTVLYSYDGNSNLQTRTDSRTPAVVTTYGYDALNRVTSRDYSDTTPDVFYYYDDQMLPTGAPVFERGTSTGRLVAVLYGGSASTTGNYQGYDEVGRAVVSLQKTDTLVYQMSYGYDLAGNMTGQTYPSGRTISTAYDAAGRISSVSGQKSGEADKTYASQMGYTSHGAVKQMQLGNQRWEHALFNSRLQPVEIGLGTSATDSSLLKLEYSYNTAGQANNNGNILSQKLSAPKTAGGTMVLTQIYSYDSLNRLSGASENGVPAFSESFSYDRWGNMWVSGASGVSLSPHTPQSVNGFNQSTNRLSNQTGGFPNVQYDGAGNLKRDAVASTFSYDGESRQTRSTVNGVVVDYSYDGEGRRVKKVAGSVTTVFVYNVAGQLVAEYSSDPVPAAAGGGGTSYLTQDHLGSTRVVTKGDGSVKARYDYLPFGEELVSSAGGRGSVGGYGSPDSTKQKFTSKERDSESQLDYFLARYYSAVQGRFTSVDPENAGASPDDAQSWNGYAYARNNPLVYVDPTGEDYILREYDKDGKLINTYQVKSTEQLEKLGYKVVSGNDDGSVIQVEGNGRRFTGQYVNDSHVEQVRDRSGMTPLARGVFTELDRRANASKQAIGVFAGGTAIVGGGVGAAAFAGGVALGGSSITTLGIAEGGVAGGTAATEIIVISEATRQAFLRQLVQHGRASLEKSLQSFEKRLAEHLRNLEEYRKTGGYTSSVETEIRIFKESIQAIKEILGK